MKTKSLRKNKVNVVTLGCAKNLFDSEVMMTQLKGNNFDVQHESKEESEIVIVNTCGFIDNAKQESVDTILQYAEAKEKGLIDKLYVTGCLSARYKDDLEKEIPEVDSFFGTKELPKLLKTLKADYKKELVGERLLTTPSHYAYFKIAEGCDRPCSFCAIPLMRGNHISTPIDELVENAKNLAKNGVKELLLIAQDSTFYGLDLYKDRKLAELMLRLSDVEGIEWIRLHYAFPTGFPMDVIKVMKERENICNYLDMPLQHASTDILKSMRRGTTKDKTTELIKSIRDVNSEIALRTSMIVGYPGETQDHFKELCNWVEDMKFERLGVFKYSHEENTHAYSLKDNVPQEVKNERAEILMDIQSGISFDLNQKKVGNTYKVLFDKVEGDYFLGRTEFDSPEVDNEVVLKNTEDNFVRIGDFANVQIDSADHFDLYGHKVD